VTIPDPMTPADCDLRGLEYMPLLGQRLFGSEFDAMASDSEWRAGVTLWWAAWTQCPAGSVPDDDTALCRLADLGRDLKTWKKLRARALHGFVKCSDGRLYHPTLAQQALVAWDKRVKERERKAQWRAKKLGQEASTDGDVPRDTTRTEPGQDADVPADVTRRDVTGRDDSKKKKNSVADATAPSASKSDPPPDPAAAAETHLWDTGKRFLQTRGVPKTRAGSMLGLWKGKHGTAAVIEALGVAQVEPDLVDPIPFIERVLQRRSGNSSGGDGWSIGGTRMSSPC